MFLLRFVGLDDRNHFHFLELVLANDPASVPARRPGFGAKTIRKGGHADR